MFWYTGHCSWLIVESTINELQDLLSGIILTIVHSMALGYSAMIIIIGNIISLVLFQSKKINKLLIFFHYHSAKLHYFNFKDTGFSVVIFGSFPRKWNVILYQIFFLWLWSFKWIKSLNIFLYLCKREYLMYSAVRLFSQLQLHVKFKRKTKLW